MIVLPENFINRMKKMLGSEFDAFFVSYQRAPLRGIRLNTLKCNKEELERCLPFQLKPSPFSELSYYIPESAEKLGFLPLHHAGAFYVQEPSAASAVTALDPKPGERILDLCAAPGGKSTQIASLLAGRGLLWSNEIVKNRANILLSNMERMGVRNAVVSSARPDILCSALRGYFDRVLVDAPCSGEGMFHRDAGAVRDWSEENVAACAVRQLAILDSASQALRENGVLVYSTCTFSPEENESVIKLFLEKHPDFILEEIPVSFGRDGQIEYTRRIYPMDGGEGHFVARMRRVSANHPDGSVHQGKPPAEVKMVQGCWEGIFLKKIPDTLEQVGKQVLILPQEGLPRMNGLGVLRAGVLLGEQKPGRVEPAHALFMSACADQLRSVVDFNHDSEALRRFLCGEELECPETIRGYTAVAAEGIVTGFGKASGGRLKNHYPKGLRNNRIF